MCVFMHMLDCVCVSVVGKLVAHHVTLALSADNHVSVN